MPKSQKQDRIRKSLEKLRGEIDRIDLHLLSLLNRRARAVQKVGKLKSREGSVFYDPKRERAILNRITEKNPGPFPDSRLRAIFQEIISASRALEAPITVCFLGPEATFTHEAATRRFGRSANYIPVQRVEDVFAAVQKRSVQYGVVPIENSTEGVERRTVDLFLDSPLCICAENCLEIRHHLMGKPELSEIKRIYSHQQAFAQCRNWLSENLPGVELIPVSSTARGAEKALEEPSSAAIASELASELYGLPIRARAIQDAAWNKTRFVVIGYEMPDPSSHDKTSIILFLKDEPGALHRALAPFERAKINLTNIESRPTKKEAWKYMFYIDFEGHAKNRRVSRVFKELEERSLYVKVLGSYPMESDLAEPG
jgi:chorismate mutase/prephenate dehydratase